MSHVLSIARKELRAFFMSPVAFIFLGAFLLVTLVVFFYVEGFFARNVADIRPLFAWLPVLLIFLSSAITMRQWSEEQKLGTLEILLTLPVKVHHLVLGKFLAALALVGVALLLTLGVPITVSMMGDLDWGPVIGGYVGAILLAGAYIAIGLCISAMTDNQIVALILSALVCSVFYAVGAEFVVGSLGQDWSSVLTALGTGARFESVRRGVIDFRDVLYYLAIIGSFLTINTVLLQAKSWSSGHSTQPVRRNAVMAAALIAANLLVMNVLFAPASGLRVDLTERGEYSVSKVTKNLLGDLSEPLLIRGYFSQRTHPLLAPLVPRIKDMIDEYGAAGGTRVVTEYVDPREDEDLEKEANQLYGIKSFPFKVADRLDQAVVNSYFSILVKYGDQFEVLNFGDLIEVQVTDVQNIEVKLRNLEYDLTRTVKKVAFGFQTLDAVFADMSEPAEFFAYVTPDTLPENFKSIATTIEKVAGEIKTLAGDKFVYEVIDPDQPNAKETRQSLLEKFGFRPLALSILSDQTFYLHLVLKVGDRYERLLPEAAASEADFKKELEAALKRSAPGFLKTVGLVKPAPKQPQQPRFPGAPPPPPAQPVTRALEDQLAQTYTVRDVDLSKGRVPRDVDILLLFQPDTLDDKAKFAIDQHLMQGGTVIALNGRFVFEPSMGKLLNVKQQDNGLAALLAKYGVEIQQTMVLDPQNEPIPVETPRTVRGMQLREMGYLKYPYFVDIRSDGMSDDNPAVGALPALTLPWASPIVVTDQTVKDGEETPTRETVALLSSTDASYVDANTNVMPDLETYRNSGGFGPPTGEQKARTLAVAISGKFNSAFADGGPIKDAPVIKQSPDTARLIVVGSSAFANDMALRLTRQGPTNLQFVQNLIDFGLADTDLLSIRSRGTFVRTLLPLEANERARYEYLNYGIVIVGLAAVILLTLGRRRSLKPIDLDSAPRKVSAERVEA